MSWLSQKRLKWKRRHLFNFVNQRLKQLLNGFYRSRQLMPKASKEDLYTAALAYVDAVDATIAAVIMEASIEHAEQLCESLDLRIVAKTFILLSISPRFDHLLKERTTSPFAYNKPTKLEDTFTTYYEIIVDVIPPNI